MENEFSVCQFFDDGSYAYVCRWVTDEVAVAVAKNCTTSIGAKSGITVRVIITDGGDCCVFEWKRGEGVVFPAPTVS